MNIVAPSEYAGPRIALQPLRFHIVINLKRPGLVAGQWRPLSVLPTPQIYGRSATGKPQSLLADVADVAV
ncbi:hypothetical protein [Mycobacteroides chelonae]|uniref:hypothetical protein n=1 Tax=Mycobacteroides chelonae TaxID=1774 RepID=UPI000D6A7881|nr:hypothetical protein [Mycobacteroides chelonae]